MNLDLMIVRNKIVDKLVDIEDFFKQKPEITIVIRMNPEDKESELVITSEKDLDKIKDAIDRAKARDN